MNIHFLHRNFLIPISHFSNASFKGQKRGHVNNVTNQDCKKDILERASEFDSVYCLLNIAHRLLTQLSRRSDRSQ